MKKHAKQIIFYVILIAVIIVVCALIFKKPAGDEINYDDILKVVNSGDVSSVTFDENTNKLTIVKADKKTEIEYKLPNSKVFYDKLHDPIAEKAAGSENVDFKLIAPKEYSAWLSYLPMILIIVALIVMYVIMTRQISGSGGGGKMGGFSKSRAKMAVPDDKNKVTFADVAGADEEKEELEEIVEFLKNPGAFAKLGAKIPHGVLLMGPPGTGKTLLAKAVAGEAGVPFFSISGSDFVEMYVGVGASRVRDLFENARKSSAAIIFIDEIDAVGRHRGAGLGGGHDEREQTLNQLLVEMDGFGSHEGIIVMAATNRPDILDPALLRPGRFDRQITVNYPDINGRVEILKVHSKNKPLEPAVDLKDVAKMTVGFTGADLANLLNEAALLATRRGKSLIGMEDIEDAFIKVIAGPKKKARAMKESEKKHTAYHEAGHAMIAYYLDLDPVQQISIIPSGRALGYTLNPPVEDKYSEYKSELNKDISMLLGGRAAEEIVYGDVSGGASNDIERATATAKKMVMRLGMSDVLGTRCFGNNQSEVFLGRDFSSSQDYSDATAAKIDNEIHDIISKAYELAKKLLSEHRDKLDFIAEFLVKNEIMDGDQFKAVMETEDPSIEQIEEIAAEKKRKSAEANIAEQERLAAIEAEDSKTVEEPQPSENDTSEDDTFEDDTVEESHDEVQN
ncbi:MAG: ATP-dependent zinc metalloprotease FtsH [Ruminococcaceae bacterium]|nr:ATP-dependent zinc metalloprotease FtsH [Oscillospiraceae bacterium]